MPEVVYNLIAYFDEMEIVSFLGIATHQLDGSDEQKLRFLSAQVASDSKVAARFLLPDRYKLRGRDGQVFDGNNTTLEYVRQLIRANKADLLFEEALTVVGAPMQPLVCVTPVYEPTDTSLAQFEAYMHPSQFRGA